MRRSISMWVRARAPSAAEAAARRRPVNRRHPASAGVAEPRVHPRPMGRGLLCCVAFAALLAPLRPARAQVIGEAVELERAGRFDGARAVLVAGQRALGGGGGRAGALAVELADLAARRGDWEDAAREWGRAATAAPDQVPNAAAQLAEVPPEQRERVTRALVGDPSPVARRLGAELLLAWGDPARAWAVFEPAITAPGSPQAAFALRRFADLAAAGGSPEGRRVRALALARLADAVPQPVAARARADAARALLDAGDFAAARRAPRRLAADSTAPADAQALATSALVEALIREGALDAATARLAAAGDRVPADDRAGLRRGLVRARIRRREPARADPAPA